MIREFNTDSLSQCQGMARLSKALWPKGLIELTEVIDASLRHNLQLATEQSQQYSDLAVATIAKHAGGQYIYLPTGKKLQTALRHAAMVEDSQHLTVREVAAKYDVTEVVVYQALVGAGQAKRSRKTEPEGA